MTERVGPVPGSGTGGDSGRGTGAGSGTGVLAGSGTGDAELGRPSAFGADRAAVYGGARRILLIRLDAMGDLLMTTPAIRAVRRGARDAHLTLLTSPAAAQAAALLDEIDETVVYDAPWMKASAPRQDGGRDLALIDRLAAGAFDAAIVFTVNTQTPLPAALMCLLAGIPARLAHCRENPYGLLTDWIPEPEPDLPLRHEVRRQLDLVASVGFVAEDEHLSLRVPPAATRRMRALAADLGLTGGAPWAVVHPGASAPSRRYPPERFGAAAGRLATEDGWRIVVVGSAGEADLVEAVRSTMGAPSIPLVGRLGVDDLAALLSFAPLLIGNNAGPAHVAAAVGTPVVLPYALTNRQHAPWGVPTRVLTHDVPCRDCRRSTCPLVHHLCLRGIPSDAVVDAARDLLAATRGRSTALGLRSEGDDRAPLGGLVVPEDPRPSVTLSGQPAPPARSSASLAARAPRWAQSTPGPPGTASSGSAPSAASSSPSPG